MICQAIPFLLRSRLFKGFTDTRRPALKSRVGFFLTGVSCPGILADDPFGLSVET